MDHEARKASARNSARLAAAPNRGRTMAHKSVKKGHLVDDSEIAEGLAARDVARPKCHYCGETENLERQIAGFWFCFDCLQRAEAKGGYYWTRMAENPKHAHLQD